MQLYTFLTDHLLINLEKKESHEISNYGTSIVTYHPNYNFRGENYIDVFEVQQDTIDTTRIIKVSYMLRAIPGGILKFYDSNTKEMWELIKQYNNLIFNTLLNRKLSWKQ